jgi:hypothetical protein
MTAVEWFNEEINKSNVGTDAKVFIAKLLEKAKEIEKQQILDFTINAVRKILDEDIQDPFTLDQYYNETFKR